MLNSRLLKSFTNLCLKIVVNLEGTFTPEKNKLPILNIKKKNKKNVVPSIVKKM